ncbi:hypothetical protein ACFQBQ_12830 [Granulicella cerasi]|uniref:Glycosyltransferase RgtA/B/C/D-like domain-containing protein n=1 Tax=Granulicella cerasi TaxID=741063 RepID=A0ABW1ZC76_9BACT|nr:hypothetical protein [Granulicella cerasi]
MKLRGFTIARPQQIAGLLLLIMLGLCAWNISREPLSADDYRVARCGREMWERPEAIAGYFTSCGNLNGDGFFGYRTAALPLSLERGVLLATDHFRKPENRLYTEGSLNGSLWEARHEMVGVKWLLRLPFVFFALWAGGGVWWVSRRLFGNEGGALALALYVFCPAIIRHATHPSNDILALWGLYGLVYTAIGVGHALQGPRKKWRPRIVLLTVALGLTASAHTLAGIVGWLLGAVFFFYVAERRRSLVLPIMAYAALGALLVLFVVFGFRPSVFLYLFTGGSARCWMGLEAAKHFFLQPANAGISIAALVSLLLYATTKRSRYFGNTVPLLCVLALMPLYTTQIITAPWLWAVPFLLTFIGGVFADVLETRYRKTYLLLAGGVIVAQAGLCVMTLGGWLR